MAKEMRVRANTSTVFVDEHKAIFRVGQRLDTGNRPHDIRKRKVSRSGC